MGITIVPFKPEYATAFYDLNIEWLKTYFYVEPFDEEVLSKPQRYILDRGGHLFFALEGDTVLGTVALMPHNGDFLELTKMAVDPKSRGKKIGQQLMRHCVDFAKENRFNLLLYSSRKLENAIYIYKKFGFVEIPVEPNSPYKRSDIKMMLRL
ncbi:MAG: GNAT family N-acetyltransferase [Flavobacteriaceae bacterium]